MKTTRLDLPCDPLAAAAAASGQPGLCLLYSGVQVYGFGRYSILAARPRLTFAYADGVATVVEDGEARRERTPLLEALAAWLPRSGRAGGELPFYGGAIGYLAYEAGRHWEPRMGSGAVYGGCDARFALFDGAVVFDHAAGAVFATCEVGDPEQVNAEVIAAIRSGGMVTVAPFRLGAALRSNFTRDGFVRAVEKVRELIRAGEVYQVNLSQRFAGPCGGSAFDLFLRLAETSPAPYAAYLDFGDEQIVSSSPERFLLLQGRAANTRPIKGTRPIGRDETETEANERELAASEKDRSELLMIVDLERNDLGRVCEPGSVVVENLFALERYATVIHQTASVSGRLEEGLGWIDGVRAMFPGGSITGAPKIRSMQVIADLEAGFRGIYTGAIGYVNTAGDADFNIAIRTLRVADGEVTFQVGGGIVWDSDPESEYEETLVKARAMVRALGGDYD